MFTNMELIAVSNIRLKTFVALKKLIQRGQVVVRFLNVQIFVNLEVNPMFHIICPFISGLFR